MSFILDALKKAESEHSRHAGPVLMDVRIAPKRQRLPAWAWVLGCVLLANLLMLAWLLLRRPADTSPPPAVAAGTAATAPSTAVAPVVQPQPSAAVNLPPASAPAATQPAVPPVVPAPTVVSAPVPAPAAAVIPPPAPVQARPSPPASIDNLPTMQDLLASGVVLPALQLNLHVYDEVPANRFVFVNSRRLREGDELMEGIRVERITPAGVVFDARGRRFLLAAGG